MAVTPQATPIAEAGKREHQILGVLERGAEADQRQSADQSQPARQIVADRQHGHGGDRPAQRERLHEAALIREPLVGGPVDPGERGRQDEGEDQSQQREVPPDRDVPHIRYQPSSPLLTMGAQASVSSESWVIEATYFEKEVR